MSSDCKDSHERMSLETHKAECMYRLSPRRLTSEQRKWIRVLLVLALYDEDCSANRMQLLAIINPPCDSAPSCDSHAHVR